MENIVKTEQLYEGKAKKVFATNDPDLVIVDYKDDATAFNGEKKGTIVGKGAINNKMTNYMFKLLEKEGIPTHLVEEISDRETIVKKVEIVPLEVIVRNVAAGSFSKKLGIEEGTKLKQPTLEFSYKCDELGDPFINKYYALGLGLATEEEIEDITKYAFKVNEFMLGFFKNIGIDLIDFKIEFGRFHGKILLADEISPDTCRFWDSKTHEKLDKDRFRRDMGGVKESNGRIISMGGFFGAVSANDCIQDVFFGTDYHSHLGTRRGGMTSFSPELGFQRNIHSIENSPFRTKFEKDVDKMRGNICIGCISDTDPQPIMVRSKLGLYAVCSIGVIQNAAKLADELLEKGCANFETMSSGAINSAGLIGALIAQKDSFVDGIRYAQDKIEGTMSLAIMTDKSMIVARDKDGRLPIIIGQRSDGYCFSFESFAYQKLGYSTCHELKAGEITEITKDGYNILSEGTDKKKICTFLWTYYGYPTACYEGVNVELMRTRNGEIMAENDMKNGRLPDVDFVCGIPDSGVPHAIGYANKSGIPFARPFIKYTPTWPRSFMPTSQSMRNRVAKMKLIPVHELIEGKKLLFVDDSIVRGTQMRETVEFLYENGAKEVHMRSACPPIMYGCKYLNFSRSTSELELIARQIIDENEGIEGVKYIEEYSDSSTERGKLLRDEICRRLKLTSVEFQSLEGTVKAVGLPSCELCTYCWNGRE